jgi:hypothetical protein
VQATDAIDGNDFLRGHVFNELRWLLVATTNWVATNGTDDRGINHLRVMAMDSALLHARNLYEFWRGERNNVRKVFAAAGPSSELYVADGERLRKALHRKLFHLDASREFEPLDAEDDHLHERVEEIAHDVLARWDEWQASTGMSPFRDMMADVRRWSVDDAGAAANRLGIGPIFHQAGTEESGFDG